MKKLVILTLGDELRETDYLIKFPSSIKKENIEEIIEDIRKCKHEKYNLPEDWCYDEVIEVIIKKFQGKLLHSSVWRFYL